VGLRRVTPYDVVDWRRRTFAIYAEVRALADPAEAHARWVQARRDLYGTHPASAGPPAPVAPYDPAWRFVAPLDPADREERIEIATGTDGLVPFERIGRVRLGALGPLDVWRLASYGGGVWLPLRDASPRTYGGGRYVLDTVKGADLGGDAAGIVVDLNFAYNPSCAFDPRWACPLAPPGNVLAAEVPVGELTPDPST
jgi:uncharacterized protein (DUF1684 family)